MFGQSIYDEKELIYSLKNYLSVNITNSNHTLDLEEQFRHSFFHKTEEHIKTNLHQKFTCDFIIELEAPNFIDSHIIHSNHEFYQKYNLLLCQNDEQIIAFVDILSEKILNWLKLNTECELIHIKFARKQDIIDKIQKIFQIELMKFSVSQSEHVLQSGSQVNYTSKHSISLASLIILLFVLLSFQSIFFAVGAIAFFNSLYLISTFYKLLLSFSVIERKQEIIEKEEKNFQPIYTIFLPLLHENESTVTQLINAIKNISYPQHRLDIKIILEENDNETVNALKIQKLDYNFDIIIVPNGEKYEHPQTKARACNYAFNFAKGEFLTIYDGDDIPDSNQINFSIQKFTEDSEISSIQYPLNSYNSETNLYTKFYSVEFDLWYKIFLPSLQKSDMPVTFGGTSNHFRISSLVNNVWNAYNLTEDADLGIRWWLNENGKVYLSDSFTTLEEAPISLSTLIRQRSRWTKGFIQTYVTHILHKFTQNDYRRIRFLSFMNLFIILPIISNLSFLPNICEFLILNFFHQQNNLFETLGYATITLFVTSFSFQILTVIVHRKKMKTKVRLSILLFPIYSIILNVAASYKAVIQLFTKPFYWEKTVHGVDKKNRNQN